MKKSVPFVSSTLGSLLVLCVACGSDDNGAANTNNVATGGTTSVGTSATGGKASGGTSVAATGGAATGGTSPVGNNTGGMVTGGSSAVVPTGGGSTVTPTGGTTGNGGSEATGGASAAATGGAGGKATGGSSTVTPTGGTTSNGGSKATGGASTAATGGSSTVTPTGGTTGNGGTTAVGTATGGSSTVTPTGGTTGNGGSKATGGASTAATGGSAAGGNTAAGCPGTDGPTMVALPLGYCIDSTEVTQGQYQVWLNTNPSTSEQISVCSWNTSFIPTCNWTPTSTADYPVECVDWCDAYAYCAGVGKRLCGKIGGGSNGYNEYANATLSQWYAACTSNGTYSSSGYPYGNTYQATYCNGYEAEKGAAVAVGTMAQCQSTVSGYAGVYDLSGNVGEWEDSCNSTTDDQSDSCRLRGGAFNSGRGSDGLDCGYDFTGVTRGARVPGVGFRCCSP